MHLTLLHLNLNGILLKPDAARANDLMKSCFNFFQNNSGQDKHYTRLINERLPTKGLFSCGYHERFDPFMLDHKPFMIPVYEHVFSSFFNESAGNLLDVGCGTGLYWPVLSRYCKSIVGVDFSKAMISEASRLVTEKNIINAEALVQNGENLDFPDESFDSILCMDVLHHIPDIKNAISNFHRILKPGGRLFAVEPNTFNPLIFIAHLIPSEERIAIKRNYAPVLCRLLKPHFKKIQVNYINFVASAESEKQLARVESVGKILLSVPFLRFLSLRQMLIMEKRV